MHDLGHPVPFGYTPTWDQRDKYNVKKPVEDDQTPIRLGIIGLGGIAQGKHLPAIARLQATGNPVKTVAGVEAVEPVRAKVEQQHGFPCYRDYRQMFEEEAIDAVEVLTDPGEIRLRIMQDAIERDLHMFVEKPLVFLGVNRLAESILASQHLVSIAESKGLVVMTGFVKRFSSPYQVAHHLINSEALGELSMVAVKMCQGWSRHILLEGQACHMLDMARYLGGEIKGLQALAVNRYGEPSYPYDNVVVNVDFASGAIGTLYFSSSSLSLKPWERVEIFGERKWLAVEDGMSTTLHDSEQGPSKSWAPVFPNTLLFDEEFGGYVPEIKNFLDAIRGDAAALASGEDGVAALILASMIHESAKARRFVSWDEIQPEHKK